MSTMARLLLDSTVLIDALRGRPAATRMRQLRSTGVEPWVCVISVEEIWRGLRHDEGAAAQRLFRGLRLAPLGASEGERAGRWRRDFATRGLTLHQADCLIQHSVNAAQECLIIFCQNLACQFCVFYCYVAELSKVRLAGEWETAKRICWIFH